jgi:hypothetical protein
VDGLNLIRRAMETFRRIQLLDPDELDDSAIRVNGKTADVIEQPLYRSIVLALEKETGKLSSLGQHWLNGDDFAVVNNRL